VKNLTEATQLLLARSQAQILATKAQEESGEQEPKTAVISIEHWRPPEPRHVEKARLARRAGRYARYEQVVELGQQGMTPKEIAGRLGLSSHTVQRWLAAGTFPEARKRRKKLSSFDAFAPYVLKRWKEGEHKGITLYREIKAQGYTGSDRSVYRYLATLKRAEIQVPINVERIKKYTPTTAVWLGCRVIPKHWMRASKRIWRPSCEPVRRSKEPTTSFNAFWPWSTSGKETA
jgi:transcriptional regulator with XRE-family HTH domain